jgi:hypothetical protein
MTDELERRRCTAGDQKGDVVMARAAAAASAARLGDGIDGVGAVFNGLANRSIRNTFAETNQHLVTF